MHRPNSLKVIDPTSHAVVFTYNELEQGISVILPVDNCQVKVLTYHIGQFLAGKY